MPLLGPPTSIGDVHHGAWYYYLLSPAAALTGGDSPLAVVALIALAGIAAVGVVWWLARRIGGPVAGLVAGLDDGGLDRRRRRIDLHLEPEPHRALERGRAGRRVAGVVGWGAGLVAGGRHRDGGDDAVPRAGRRAPADRRRPVRARCPPAAARGAWQSGWSRSSSSPTCRSSSNEATTGFSETSRRARLPGRWPDRDRGGHPGPFHDRRSAGRELAADRPDHRRCWCRPCWPWSRWWPPRAAGAKPPAGALGRPLDGPRPALDGGLPHGRGAEPGSVIPGLPNDHYHAFADPMVFVLVGLGAGGRDAGALRARRWAAVRRRPLVARSA